MKNFKKVALIGSVFGTVFLLVLVGVYFSKIEKSPYQVGDFVHLTYQWGNRSPLENSYQSAGEGNYRYLDRRDSLLQLSLKLRPNDRIYLHQKLSELGFWRLPDTVGKPMGEGQMKYELEVNYRQRTKRLVIFEGSGAAPLLIDSAMRVNQLVRAVIDAAHQRYSK